MVFIGGELREGERNVPYWRRWCGVLDTTVILVHRFRWTIQGASSDEAAGQIDEHRHGEYNEVYQGEEEEREKYGRRKNQEGQSQIRKDREVGTVKEVVGGGGGCLSQEEKIVKVEDHRKRELERQRITGRESWKGRWLPEQRVGKVEDRKK